MRTVYRPKNEERLFSSRHLKFYAFLIVGLLAFPTFGLGQQDARKELEKRNIAFDANTFVEHAARGNRAVVELVMAAGLNVNSRNKGGRSAILLAAREGRADVVRALLARRADIDQASQGDFEQGKTALMFATQRGHVTVVQILLDASAKVNQTSHAGKTALMYAAEAGRTAA